MADLIPTQIQQQQVGFAPEVAPYAQDLLGRAQALTDFTQFPYQQYMGERFAQFTPLQQQAFAGAQAMEAAPQLADASALAGTAGLQALGYGGYRPMQYSPESFSQQGVAGRYMNPYMEQVLAPQLQQMQRQADIQRSALGAQAAKSGAFGGARTGLMESQLNADLMRQKQQAVGQAYGQSFGQAMQQFNQEQAQRQAAAQLGEQSRQYGAGLGLQGLQTALQSAQQLGALGSSQFGQNLSLNQLQAQYGGQQQQRMQDILNSQYQDFLNFQNYPYKQLGFMSDIIRGVPLMQTGATVYQQPPSTLGTLAGLGLGAYGLMRKEGGTVSSYADGGAVGMAYGGDVTSDNYVEGAIKRLSNAQLQQALKNALDRRDVKQAEMLQDELRERAEAASYSRGLASVAPQNMEEMLPSEESMRRGGIVSFAEPTEENNYSLVEEPSSPAGRFFSGIRGKLAEKDEMDRLRNQVGVKYGKSASISGLFMDQTDAERQRAKDIMANLDRYSKDELRALAGGDAGAVPYPTTGGGRGAPKSYERYDTKEAAAALAKVPMRDAAPAPAPAAPKGGKKADPAAKAVGTAMAQVTGSSPEDEIAKAKKYLNFFKEEDAALYKAMQEQIDDIKSKSKEIGESRTRDALSAFGFKMAAAASQVGAGSGLSGALRAAGAAAPTITESVRESDKMQREYDRLSKQMQVAMLQSKVAASRGDKQTALGLIKAAEQADIQRQQLRADIDYKNRHLGVLQGRNEAMLNKQRLDLQKAGLLARNMGERRAQEEFKNVQNAMNYRKQGITLEALAKRYSDEEYQKLLLGMTSLQPAE